MACFHPLRAWRTQDGTIVLSKEKPDSTQLRLPCGGCLGCRMAKAQSWALRCHLELQQHQSAVFTTLTKSDDNINPPTLDRHELSRGIKRIREAARRAAVGPLRYFACGEYGEQTQRPHYHAIIYGLNSTHRPLVEEAWGLGITHTVDATPATISYTAGYTAKKVGWKIQQQQERVDPETGEVYQWVPPFLQMSRRPGIGGHARQWPESWRLYAIKDGHKMAVPRFLHESWKQQATETQKEELIYEKSQILRDTSETALQQQEQYAIARQALVAEKRKL